MNIFSNRTNPSSKELERRKAELQNRKDERKRKWKDPSEDMKYVCHGGKVQCKYCSSPIAPISVTAETVMLQDKPWATVGDNNGKVNFGFAGSCMHPKWNGKNPPCNSVIGLGKWKNYSETIIGSHNALLAKSTIPCMVSGEDVKIVDSGQKATLSKEDKAKIVDYWWSYSVSPKGEHINRAYLEETVYFHIQTENAGTGFLKLKLWDDDFLFDDEVEAPPPILGEDKGFGEIPIYDNHGVCKLVLPLDWTEDLKAEGPWEYRSLYCQITDGSSIFDDYKNKELDEEKGHLNIYLSKRDLYVEPSRNSKSNWINTRGVFPEIYDTKGNNISVIPIYEYDQDKALEVLGGEIAGHVKSKVAEAISRYGSNKLRGYALAKLQEGYLKGNNGRLYVPKTSRGTARKIDPHIMYTNEGECVEVLSGRITAVTRGIDQVGAAGRIGLKGEILGLLKNTGKLLNIFDNALSFAELLTWAKDNDHSKPIPIPVVGGLSELMMQGMDELMADIDRATYNSLRKHLDETKKKGLYAVEGVIYSGSFKAIAEGIGTGIEYRTMPISIEQMAAILRGEILYFDKLKYDVNSNLKILFRRQTDTRRNNIYIYIIETFFINLKSI